MTVTDERINALSEAETDKLLGKEAFRLRVKEIVDSRKGEDSYAERLKESFDELLFSISQTIGKVEGGDMTSSQLLEADLENLQRDIKKLKDLLP